MATPTRPTGNPVFDFKAGFRTRAQSVQRVLFLSGVMEIAAGLAGRFVTLDSFEMNLALRYAPLLGLATLGMSGIWGFVWRSKLRNDFQREFSIGKIAPPGA